MSISDRPLRATRVVLSLVLFAATVFATARCAPTDECLRISDCDDGLTCIRGKCRVREVETPDADGGTTPEGGAPATDASTAKDSSVVPPPEAGSDAGDASTDGPSSSDEDAGEG